MKKRFPSLLILILLLAGSVLGLTACKQNTDDKDSDSSDTVAPHTHEFSMGWSYDELAHWHACHMTGCSVISKRASHRYGEDGTRCTVCGKERKADATAQMLGSRTESTWSLSAAEEHTLIYTQRDLLGRVLTRTHYQILDTLGSQRVAVWNKLREEVFTYEDGKILFSVSYSYASDDPRIPDGSEATVAYTTKYRYDTNGVLVRADVLKENGQATGCYDRYIYGENGKITAIRRYDAGLLTQTLTLNEWGDPIRIQDRFGNDYRYTYDSAGNTASVTNGTQTRSLSCAENAPLTVTVTDTKANESLALSLTVDKQDRVTGSVTKTDSLELSTEFTYDGIGRLTGAVSTDTKTKKAILTMVNGYGESGAILSGTVTETQDGNTVLSTEISYEYGEDGAPRRILYRQVQNGQVDATTRLSLTYENGRLKQKQTPAETVEYTYGENGALTGQTVTTYTEIATTLFDELGNPTSLTLELIDHPVLRCTFDTADYDYRFLREFAKDDRTAYDFASRIASDLYSTERIFDDRRRITEEITLFADGTTRWKTEFTYDELDRLRTEERIVETLDESENLLNAERIVIDYDAYQSKVKETHYDADGAVTLELEYKTGGSGSYLSRKTEYDEDGAKTVTLYDEDGEETVTRYDQNGALIPAEDNES